MDESDFEGTLVLEKLAGVGRVDDFKRAVSLMKQAKVDSESIATVLRKMAEASGEP